MKLYNTLSRELEEFTPREGNEVTLYTCGLTVYSQPHIGNWVAYIYWDILVRVLKANGYDVKRVQNITDVGHLTSDEDAGEDKMLVGALKEGKSAWEVAEKYIKIADNEAYKMLGLIRPDHMPRATKYIQQQKAFVEELNEKGFTYVIEDGIYFDTSKLSSYGELARLNIKGLRFGARVEDTGKKNPTDFAVWKFSSPTEKRDMEWDSPIVENRKGFPGWHLECSVMAREIFGDQIDIHTGGVDHIAVHHTNEIAQTEAVTGKKFSNFWMHANHIKVDGTKMAKSLGNVYTLQDIIDKGFDLQAFKLLVLSKHYRTEGNFTWEILEAAQNGLSRVNAAADLRWQAKNVPAWLGKSTNIASIKNSLFDDLNTPLAVAFLYGFATQAEDRLISIQEADLFVQHLSDIDAHLGLNLSSRHDITNDQKQLIQEREDARKASHFAKADEIRDQLRRQQIELRDTSHGAIWYRS